ncbi:MAG: hypothetical protein JWQ11_1915 [Rhizobacter sp.]|nr:hypothetical protein [Rhizobacter sp.]
MKNNVYLSFENADHDRCVDIFERPDGSFGFEEFRRDVEDQGRWQSMARYSERLFMLETLALAAVASSVRWLAEETKWQQYCALKGVADSSPGSRST